MAASCEIVPSRITSTSLSKPSAYRKCPGVAKRVFRANKTPAAPLVSQARVAVQWRNANQDPMALMGVDFSSLQARMLLLRFKATVRPPVSRFHIINSRTPKTLTSIQ